MVLALVTCLVWAGAGASTAYAHANLERSVPARDARVTNPVTELILYFTQQLKREGSWLKLLDAAGKDVALSPTVDGEAKTIRATLPTLAPAVYTVEWQSLSLDDDDYADGKFQFTVLRADGSDPGTTSPPASEVTSDDNGSGVAMLIVAVVAGIALLGGAVFIMRRPRRVS